MPLQAVRLGQEITLRLRQLDGLRAVALMMVLLIHHDLLKSGWAGVDIFFVLSGFLITGILRRESGRHDYWKSFYVRRTTRILPPLLLLVAIALLTAKTFRLAYLGYLLFAGNILQMTEYSLAILAPLWSLAIEEHFYFLWPLAAKKLQRETLLRLSIAIVFISPFLRILGTILIRHWWKSDTGWDNPIFLLTPFRLDGLAAGSALALFVEDNRRPAFLSRWSGWMCFAITTLFLGFELADRSFRRTTDSLLFNSLGYSLVVLASFFLLSFLVLRPGTMLARILSSSPAVFLGSISYGVYLYEEGVIFAMRTLFGWHTSLRLLFLPDLLVTGILASASFYWIEKPVMAWAKLRLGHSNADSKFETGDSAVSAKLQVVQTYKSALPSPSAVD
jgi:peptidoglycan/LPS O-acetylase OafA/YrhL